MAINVIKVGEVAGNKIIPLGGKTAVTDFVAVLAYFDPVSQPADECRWQIDLIIGEGPAAREVIIDLAPFISSPDYIKSKTEPIFLSGKTATMESKTLIFFRGRFFFPERAIYTEADKQEVILRVKNLKRWPLRVRQAAEPLAHSCVMEMAEREAGKANGNPRRVGSDCRKRPWHPRGYNRAD